jgi:hypothetical protein
MSRIALSWQDPRRFDEAIDSDPNAIGHRVLRSEKAAESPGAGYDGRRERNAAVLIQFIAPASRSIVKSARDLWDAVKVAQPAALAPTPSSDGETRVSPGHASVKRLGMRWVYAPFWIAQVQTLLFEIETNCQQTV